MKTKRRNGFTLLELIISITIIALMSLMFVQLMTHSFWSQYKIRQQTAGVLDVQRQVEEEILALRRNASSGAPFQVLSDVFVPGHSVRMSSFRVGEGRNAVYAVAVDYKDPEPVLPIVGEVKISASKARVEKFPLLADGAAPIITGSHTKTNTVTSIDTHYWYVSAPGFNIPVPDAIAEGDVGTRFPMFPEQYRLIPIVDKNPLEFKALPSGMTVQDLAGRHIVLEVVPANVDGKLGVPVQSKPLLIGGLPYHDNLALRLEGSYVAYNKDLTAGTKSLKQWTSLLAGGTVGTIKRGAPTLADDAHSVTFIADRVAFRPADLIRFNNASLKNKQTTTFLVVSGRIPASFVRATNGSSMDPAAGQVNLLTGAETIPLNDGYLLYVCKNIRTNGGVTTIDIGGTGGTDVEVAELLVYGETVESSKIEAIKQYLISKYMPVIKDAPILAIDDVHITIDAKDPFVFPKHVPAWLQSGYRKNVEVEQTSGSFDAEAPGEYRMDGRSVEDHTKTFKLILTVKKVPVYTVSWSKKLSRIKIGESVSNTVTVLGKSTVHTAPTDPEFKDPTNPALAFRFVSGQGIVNWDPSTLTLTAVKSGTVIVEAISEDDPTKTDRWTIRIDEPVPVPDGLVLHLDASAIDSSLLNGNQLNGWNDVSGAGNHFAVYGSRKPTLIADGELVAVRFERSSVIGRVPSVSFGTTGGDPLPSSTIVIFAKHSNSSYPLVSQYEKLASGKPDGMLFQFGGRSSDRVYVKVDDEEASMQITSNSATQYHFDYLRFEPTYFTLDRYLVNGTWNNRTATFSTDDFQSISGGSEPTFLIGDQETNNNSVRKDVYEILMFNRKLANWEIQSLNTYFRNKWNISY